MSGRSWRIVSCGLVALAGACEGEAPATGGEPKAAEAATKAADATVVEPSKREPVPAEPPPSGHAVAKVGSLLFLSSTGDVGFELPPMGPAAGMTVAVVGEQDGRLAVETLAAEHHCAATLDGLADFRLRLHLTRAELLPVLTEELLHEASDGTKLRIAPGVPVPAGSRELDVRGTSVRVTVPAERLGRFYSPGRPFAAEDGDGFLFTYPGHPLTYDGGHTLDEAKLYAQDEHVRRFGAVERASDALVTVRNPCLEATTLVSLERLRAVPMPGTFVGYMDQGEMSPYEQAVLVKDGKVGGPTAKVHAVRAGTAIQWSDGRPAGQVTADHAFGAPPRDEGGRTCFDAPLVDGQATTVTLCFASGQVDELVVPTIPAPGELGLGTAGAGTPGPAGTPAGETEEGGGLGSSSGSGSSSGGGSSSSSSKPPKAKPSTAKVKGTLDKDLIRRVVRAHLNEVRYCYNQGLAKDPSLRGKVSIQFNVGTDGTVPVAVVAENTTKDAAVGACIAKAVKRWTFPRPTGGTAVVTYPFVLESAE